MPAAKPVKLNLYALLSRAVEEGVARGYTRAHKHTDAPDEDTLKEAIELAIMSEMTELFIFDGEGR